MRQFKINVVWYNYIPCKPLKSEPMTIIKEFYTIQELRTFVNNLLNRYPGMVRLQSITETITTDVPVTL